MIKKLLVMSTVAILGISSANAHGVWAGMRADKMQVVYGEGPLDNFYNPKWFESVKGFDANFKPTNVMVVKENNKLFLEPCKNTQVIAIVSNNGYWSNTKKGWVNKAKDENPEATKGKYHRKMSVNYISQNIVFKKDKPIKIEKTMPVGLEIEIVPSVDPRFLKMGDTFKVQVLHNSKPMANTEIMNDSINRLGETIKTDENGFATVKVLNNGVNMIAVETSFEREDKTKADANGFFSSLNFTIFN